MMSTIVSLFHKIFEKTDKRWIRQSKPKSMKMVPCIFKKKVNHALSGSVFQTICGKFGNSNCTAVDVGLLFHITFICCSSSKAYRPTVCYRFTFFCLLIKKWVFFQFYSQKWSRTEWIALQKNQSSGDFGPAPKQTNIFFGGWFYLGTTSVMHRKTKVTSPPKSIHDTFGNILLWIFSKEDIGSHFVEKTIFNQLIQHSSDLL